MNRSSIIYDLSGNAYFQYYDVDTGSICTSAIPLPEPPDSGECCDWIEPGECISCSTVVIAKRYNDDVAFKDEFGRWYIRAGWQDIIKELNSALSKDIGVNSRSSQGDGTSFNNRVQSILNILKDMDNRPCVYTVGNSCTNVAREDYTLC